MSRKPVARDKLDAFGLDALCEAIGSRKALTEVAKKVGVSLTRLLAWIAADSERSARVREARKAMAVVWDEEAEAEIRKARTELGLKKAKEIAHHYRWRAAKVAPGEYGERLAVDHGVQDNLADQLRAARERAAGRES